jgi:hypothetical protein
MVDVTPEDIEAADRFDLHWYADFDKAQAEALVRSTSPATAKPPSPPPKPKPTR